MAAYYNTTGVNVGSRMRYRWTVGGDLRFNSREGFNWNFPSRMLGRVFECCPPEIWQGHNRVLFGRPLLAAQRPDYFLFVTTGQETGFVDVASPAWKSEDAILISLSENGAVQEAMLLMPAYSWIRGKLGTFFVEPSLVRPWTAELQLGRVG
jgi:hypothetical protein